jgi:hypothetical protein
MRNTLIKISNYQYLSIETRKNISKRILNFDEKVLIILFL